MNKNDVFYIFDIQLSGFIFNRYQPSGLMVDDDNVMLMLLMMGLMVVNKY